jgi:hypothetical protein
MVQEYVGSLLPLSDHRLRLVPPAPIRHRQTGILRLKLITLNAGSPPALRELNLNKGPAKREKLPAGYHIRSSILSQVAVAVLMNGVFRAIELRDATLRPRGESWHGLKVDFRPPAAAAEQPTTTRPGPSD